MTLKLNGINDIEMNVIGTFKCEECGKNIQDKSDISLGYQELNDLATKNYSEYELYRECQHCEEFNKWVSMTLEDFSKEDGELIKALSKSLRMEE